MKTQKMETIGGRLKKLRLERGLTQEQLALKVHFGNKGMVSAYETGKRELSMGALLAYVDYFDISADWILKGDILKEIEINNCAAITNKNIEKMVELYCSISDDRVKEVAIKQLEILAQI